mmetsp:Transcript_270/g.477  ORF Transcript_270/g.477 Transcript_270/m.477 type:complete len:148 (-) Transcript_270:5001-5444(-)
MVNQTHLKVLVKKDFLTLWRNRGFLYAFVLLPLILIGTFIAILEAVGNGTNDGKLFDENFKFTSNQVLQKFQFGDFDPLTQLSTMAGCGIQNAQKYTYSKIGIVAEDEELRNNAATFFTNVVLPLNFLDGKTPGLPKFEVEAAETAD